MRSWPLWRRYSDDPYRPLDTLACRCDLADRFVDVALPQVAGPRRRLLRARFWLLTNSREAEIIVTQKVRV